MAPTARAQLCGHPDPIPQWLHGSPKRLLSSKKVLSAAFLKDLHVLGLPWVLGKKASFWGALTWHGEPRIVSDHAEGGVPVRLQAIPAHFKVQTPKPCSGPDEGGEDTRHGSPRGMSCSCVSAMRQACTSSSAYTVPLTLPIAVGRGHSCGHITNMDVEAQKG